MFSSLSKTLLAAVSLAASLHCARAVCASGQMAVGSQFIQVFTGPNSAFYEYSGFLMANNCGLIAQNGRTQDSNQLCRGGYTKGASVTCSNNKPVAAVDTQGQRWNCSPTNDGSCDNGGTGGRFSVLACCSRA
ncbi:hypothetical protein BOTBODRAFT_149810 [Botryobasidium botryosum FD-172 SS1]|uniref:Cyanovirin-N domain-containing protein n=1 Tax=Botryobasidium botryosum (strain FD-172 SS1) TaxID=930990 RepID=A0A067LS27_BOTB1|nr:hypothetical protein BOTBODRAFT_149810 [Botryobasidium botryosum FD-172 SS1]